MSPFEQFSMFLQIFLYNFYRVQFFREKRILTFNILYFSLIFLNRNIWLDILQLQHSVTRIFSNFLILFIVEKFMMQTARQFFFQALLITNVKTNYNFFIVPNEPINNMLCIFCSILFNIINFLGRCAGRIKPLEQYHATPCRIYLTNRHTKFMIGSSCIFLLLFDSYVDM